MTHRENNMKLSKDTIQVLKNFGSINPNIMLRKGSTLATISNVKNIIAYATIPEQIPVNAAIYDLNSLLSIISLFNNCEIEFNENNLSIGNDNGKVDYFYTLETHIDAAPEKTLPVLDVVSFVMDAESIKTLLKSYGALSANHLTFKTTDGKLTLILNNREDKSSHRFVRTLCDCTQDINIYIDINDFKIIPGDYNVTIATTKSKKTCLLRFDSIDSQIDLKYFISCETGSFVKD